MYLSDTCKSRALRSNGVYQRVRLARNGLAVDAQEHLLRVAGTADGAQRVRMMRTREDVDTAPGMTASDNRQQESGETDGVTSDV